MKCILTRDQRSTVMIASAVNLLEIEMNSGCHYLEVCVWCYNPQSNSHQSHQLPKEFTLISRLQKDFSPVSPTAKGILTNVAHFQRTSGKCRPHLKEFSKFYPISPTPEEILTNLIYSRRNSGQCCPHLPSSHQCCPLEKDNIP